MNKIVLTSLVLGTALFFAAPSHAIDSTGCGLGSMAWRGQSGVVPQVLAATTNGLFGNQTFGISSGTSGCDPNGRVTGGTQKMMLAFIENNFEQFALDVASGEGETLTTLAGILDMDADVVAKKAHQNFALIFPDENADVVNATLKFYEIMKA